MPRREFEPKVDSSGNSIQAACLIKLIGMLKIGSAFGLITLDRAQYLSIDDVNSIQRPTKSACLEKPGLKRCKQPETITRSHLYVVADGKTQDVRLAVTVLTCLFLVDFGANE